MDINIDCFRDTLKYCIDNIDYEERDGSWNTITVDLNDLYNAKELNKFSKKDIMRSVVYLDQCGFIKVFSKFPENEPYLDMCSIEDITFKGHQFYESIREPTIWEKTKSVATNVGNHTLSFIETVAHDIAVESAKQAVTVITMKNQTN